MARVGVVECEKAMCDSECARGCECLCGGCRGVCIGKSGCGGRERAFRDSQIRGARSSAGVARLPGRIHGPGRGRPGTPVPTTAGSSPGTDKLERRSPGWGLMGKSAGAVTELTMAGDVVVPRRVAGGPRGAAELQEKCQVVEGAQRHRERSPHSARSGRGRRCLTSGLRRPQTPRPPSPARCGLAARLRPLPLARCTLPAPAPAFAWLRPSPGCGQRAHTQPAASDCGTLPFRGRPLRSARPPHPSLPLPPARPEEAAAEGSAA